MGSENDHQFPGFKTFEAKDEYAPIRRALLSRLQRRAPRPLQLKPSVSFKCTDQGTLIKVLGSSSVVGRDFSSSSSFYQNNNNTNKDPIPLLTPLVSPSCVEKSSYILNENKTAKSC